MRIVAVLSGLLLVAACVAPPRAAAPALAPAPPPPPPVTAAPVPPPPPSLPPPALQGDWRDWPITPGDWRYTQSGTLSSALFGRTGFAPDLALRCDRSQRRITVARTAGVPAGASRITLRTTSSEASFAANVGADRKSWEATLQPRDPTLDALVFSRGRFMVSMAGMPDLIVPAWPEVARVIEDCRG